MKLFGEWRVTTLPMILPLILSLAAFVLAMIALFAGTGSQQQALEEYHIMAINVSYFGRDLIPTGTSDESPEPTDDEGGFLDELGDRVDDIQEDIQDEVAERINDIANGAVDEIAETLGISQWYSFHIMTACEGDFAPNFTDSNAWYNITNCTAQEAGLHFNLTEILDKEIEAGPLNINPADINVPDAVQQGIDLLNSCLLAIFVFYVLGCAFSGLSFLMCIGALSRRVPAGRKTILLNAVNAQLGALSLLMGSAITTAVAKKGSEQINSVGEDVHISANPGWKFITITWVAFGLMAATTIFWTLSCFFPRKTGWSSNAAAEKATRHSTSTD